MNGLEAIGASRSIRALLWPLEQYADQASELLENHPDLAPELEAASAHVLEACLAIRRAHRFVELKFEVG